MKLLSFVLCASLVLPAAAQRDNATVLHTGTRIVDVDVVVTNDAGKPVHGLPASAFHVYEDGRPENIRDFVEHRFQPGPAPQPQSLPPGEFTNAIPHLYGDTLNVVVLDVLNTRAQDQMYVHQQVEQYLTHARPGAQIALLELTTHLVLLQSFTSDPQILLGALKSSNSIGLSPLLGGGDGGNIAELRARMRDDYTADGFKQLNQFLSRIPGKKNVIYFSDGNSYGYGPYGLTNDTEAGVFDMSPLFSEASYLVSASQSSFAYIDAHGLSANGAFSATHGGIPSPGAIERGYDRIDNRYFYAQEFAETMGGQAFLNTNDLAGAMGYAIAAGSNYYSFNYHPHGHHMDGGYHSIHISLEGPAYHLVYRQSYNATAPPEARSDLKGNGQDASEQAAEGHAETPIEDSMQRGWPEMNQILYNERFVPLGTQKGGSKTDELASGSSKGPKLKAQFRNFDLTFTANASNIQTTALPDGKLRMRVEFIVLTYNDQDLLQTAVSKELDGDLTFAQLTSLQQNGLRFTLPFSAPAHGNYYVRTGIHDLTSDRIGTLEVPKSLIEKLPALNEVSKK
jgi:VWFA-related protein